MNLKDLSNSLKQRCKYFKGTHDTKARIIQYVTVLNSNYMNRILEMKQNES